MRRAGFFAAALLAAAALFWFGLGMHRGLLLSAAVRSRVAPWAPFHPAGDSAVEALTDPVWQFVPWIDLARREIAAGRAPLWNPHQDGGVPLLGNGISALGSPLLWPALAAGVARGWNPSLLLRLLVALAAAWLWLRDLGRSEGAAALGAVAFALSGAFVAWLEHPQTLTAAAVPLLLIGARRMAASPSRGAFAGLALATAVVLAGGHPETQLMAAILAGAVALHAGARGARGRLHGLFAALPAALIGAGLAAPLLFPFLEYYAASEARTGIGRHPFVLSARDLLRFVIPGLPGSNPIEAAATVSVTVLALAVAGAIVLRRDGGARFWGGAAAAILLVAYDNPAARLLATHSPVYWTRALLFLPLALAYLASGAVDRLSDALARDGRRLLAAAAPAAAVALASVELLLAARSVHGRTAPDHLRITTPLLEALRADPGIFRILPLHSVLPPNSATEYDLDDLRGYDAMAPRAWRERRREIGSFGRTPVSTDAMEPWDLAAGGAGLDSWNVKYLVLDPRFGFGAGELNARRGLDLAEVYSGPDGRILLNRRALSRARLSGEGEAVVERAWPTAWRVRVSSMRGDRLTIANPFFPGWRARLDGRTVPIEAAEGAPIALAVPPGRHTVDLLYRPFSWLLGGMTAGAAALALIFGARRLPRGPRAGR